jgi:hypothetical protein
MTPERLAAGLRQRLADKDLVPLADSQAVPDGELISSFALCSERQGWTVTPGLLPHLVTQSRDAEHFLVLLAAYEEREHGWN